MGVTFLQRVAGPNGVLAKAFRGLKFGSGFSVAERQGATLTGDGEITDYLEISATAASAVSTAVRGVVPTNVSLSTFALAQPGITYVDQDTVLLTGQTAGAENGPYLITVVSGHGVLTRVDWAAGSSQFVPGMTIGIGPNDPKYPNATFVLITPAPITLGSTSLTFIKQSDHYDVRLYSLNLADIGPAINAAIAALPTTGGVITCRGVIGHVTTTIVQDRPVTFQQEGSNFTWDVSPAWHCSANLHMDCSDPLSTQWIAGGAVSGPLFLFSGDFHPTNRGEPCIHIHHCGFIGTATTYLFNIDGQAGFPSYTTNPNFNEGHFIFEFNRVTAFTGNIACKVDHSVSFMRIFDNYFWLNKTAWYMGYNCDGHFERNETSCSDTGPGIIVAGVNIRVRDNIMAPSSYTSTQPDILIDPVQSLADGTIWIQGNKFTPENDTHNGRAKIEIKDAVPGAGVSSIDISHNFFYAADPGLIHTITGSGTLATVTVTATRPHGIAVGTMGEVHLQSVTDSSLNPIPAYTGKFTVLSTGALTFTFPSTSVLTASEHTVNGGCGLVFDAASAGIRTSNGASRLHVHGNVFGKTAYHVDDVLATSQGQGGGCVYENNVVADFAPKACPWKVFRNGGRQFSRCIASVNSEQAPFGQAKANQSTYLENLVRSSEDSSHWAGPVTGVTITAGQTDSLGTTRAILVTRDGAAANQYFAIAVNYGGGSTQTKDLYFNFRAKAGTLSQISLDAHDGTVGAASDTVQTYQLVQATAAELNGTVDLTGVTLSTLNGLTFIPTIDGSGAGTTTFTTPASIQDIATQINTTIGSAGVAWIVSGRYLKVASRTTGATSVVLNGAGTANATLGIATAATNTGVDAPWCNIRAPFKGVIVVGHGYNALFYPGGLDTLAGTLFMEFVSVSTNDSDYYPTSNGGGAKRDNSSNSRPFMPPQVTGLIGVPYDGTTKPTITAATGGVLTGSSGFDTPSCDFVGSFVLGTDSTQGNILSEGLVTVAFNKAMTATLPVVTVSLASHSLAGAQLWPHGSGCEVYTTSTTGFVVRWWTPINNQLKASRGYGMTYIAADRIAS